MKTFVLHLQSATRYERIEGVTSFSGQDGSGSFGILPGHARMMTVLTFGLARFQVGNSGWQYLALPGAIVYFVENQLFLNTRRYLCGNDYETVRTALGEQFVIEKRELEKTKESLRRLEEEMFRRVLEMNRERSA